MNELDNLALPHSVEAEQAVLGSMLIDDRCVPDVIARLSPDDFYMRQNRELYQVLYGMFNRFETIDPVTVLDRMKQAGVYDENNSVGYLRQLMEITPTAANVLEYAGIVADKALLRRVGEAAGELAELVRQEGGTAQQILEAAEQRIYAIRQGKSSRDLTHIATVMGQVWDTIKDRQASGEDLGPEQLRPDHPGRPARYGQDLPGAEHRLRGRQALGEGGGGFLPGDEPGATGYAPDLH